MGKATAKPRDSSRENRIGPREKISSRTGQLADPYLGVRRPEIQNRKQKVHCDFPTSSQLSGGTDDGQIIGAEGSIGKHEPILETEPRINAERT